MKKTKVFTSITAVILAAVLLFVTIVTINNNTKVANAETAEASVRTVELSQDTIDAQSILDEFDNATLTTEGTTTYFEGFKPLDKSTLSEIDYISEDDFEDLENCNVKYSIMYNAETNIITLEAVIEFTDGHTETEYFYGVAFRNENDEVDAILCSQDSDENIFLSDLVNSKLIENVGWLSSLFNSVITVVSFTIACGIGSAAVAVVSLALISYAITTNVVAESNYNINKTFAAPSGIINGQGTGNYDKWKFGLNYLSKNGCGPIAIYNILYSLDYIDIDLATLIHDIEGNHDTLALGLMGADPTGLPKYFNQYNISTSNYYSKNSLSKVMAKMRTDQYVLLCFFTGKGVNAHNVAIAKNSDGTFEVYNLYDNRDYSITKTSLSDILGNGSMIMGILVG